MISRTTFCSAQASVIRFARTFPMPLTSRRRSGLGLDHIEHLLAERPDQLAGVDRADAPDHAGAEILFDALDRGRFRCADEARLELLAMGAVVDPLPGGGDPFPGRHHGGVADHGDQFAMSPRPGPAARRSRSPDCGR